MARIMKRKLLTEDERATLRKLNSVLQELKQKRLERLGAHMLYKKARSLTLAADRASENERREQT